VDEVVTDGTPATFTPTSSTPVPSTQYGLCLDGANNIFVTNYEDNSVSKLDAQGNIINAAWVSTGGGSRPTSCTVNSSGDLFVGLGGSSSGAPRVLRFNSDGTPDAAHPSYTLDTSIPPFTETWI